MSISSIKRIIIRNGDIRWRRREFDSLELALKSLLEGRGEGDESIEMSRFSTDSPRSDSASKRINSGGIEWMLPDSSLIRIYLSRSHFFIKIKERIREKMLNFSFGMSLGKNDSSLKVKSYRYRSEGLEESPLGLAKLPCSIGSRRLFIEEKLPGKLSSKGWIATTVKAVVADAVGKGTNAGLFSTLEILMDNPNITMEEYIRLKEEKSRQRAIVYNDALTSKSNSSTNPIEIHHCIDEFDLKDETSLSKYDEEEQNVLYFNDLFPFNIMYPDTDNDDNEIDII
ncbi:hypothetical protein Tco_0410443 [Tanacetum coccineum]